MEIRRVEGQGSCGGPGVRYVMQWETLGANHDRERQPPLPAPSTLRIYKIVEASRPDLQSE
jgi:hypothetical protein